MNSGSGAGLLPALEDLSLDGGKVGRRSSARKTQAGNTVAIAFEVIGPQNLAIRQVQAMELPFRVRKDKQPIRKDGYKIVPG